MDGQRCYTYLFNAITDALEQMAQQNFGQAADTLKQAQIRTEEWYIEDAGS